MPRSKLTQKRQRQPDLVYNDARIAKFINYIMMDGKKDKARKIFYDAINKASESVGAEPLALVDQALASVKPDVEVRARRVGGATYQIPVPVSRGRGESLAMRWIIEAARTQKGRAMSEKLSLELMNAYNGTGAAMTKRENTHKMADANRAFAHFKW